MQVVHVTTWNERCGIATYAARMTSALSELGVEQAVVARRPLSEGEALADARILGTFAPFVRGARPGDVADAIVAAASRAPGVIHIQFNFAVVPPPVLAELVPALTAAKRPVVVTFHSLSAPDDEAFAVRMLPSLRGITGVLLDERAWPLEALARRYLHIERTPHGIPVFPPADMRAARARLGGCVDFDPLIATSGFCLPHKGLPRLVEALPRLAERFPNIGLVAPCARFPHWSSDETIEEVHALADRLGVSQRVRFRHDFLPEAELVLHLQAADWIVLPYDDTRESASGAASLALGSGRPVAVSRSPIFDSIRPFVHTLARADLAAELTGLLERPLDESALASRRKAIEKSLSFGAVARRLVDIYEEASMRANDR